MTSLGMGILIGKWSGRVYGVLVSRLEASAPPTPTPTPTDPLLRDREEVPFSRLPDPARVMVALVFGQSNAANYGETAQAARGAVYNFYQGKLYRARDPLLGGGGTGGSVWTRLGDRLIEHGLYEAVVFLSLGLTSTEIARWGPTGDRHPALLEAVTALRQRGLTPTHLLWHQGEADAYHKTSKAAYQKSFRDMVASLRAHGVSAPIFISIASRCKTNRGEATIREAQRELIDPARNLYAGPDTDTLGFEYRYDGCHFTHEGLDKASDLWLASLKAPGAQPAALALASPSLVP